MKKILVITLAIFIISCNDQVEQKHNILFISIDDLRPTMNSYNYENEKMLKVYKEKYLKMNNNKALIITI